MRNNSEQTFLQALDSFYQANEDPALGDDFPMFGMSRAGDPSPLTSDLFINANLKAHISINARDPYAPKYDDILTLPSFSSFVHTPYEDYTKLKYNQLELSPESKPVSTHHTFDGEHELSTMDLPKLNISPQNSKRNNATIPAAAAATNISKRSNKIKKNNASKARNPNLKRLVSGTYQNIIKNFIKAISSFATSDLALPYLIPLIDNTSMTQEKFVDYVFTYKEKVDSLRGLVELTLPEEGDNKETIICKNIFKELSIVFLKYFAVNWIFGSNKIKHRKVLLKNRFIIKRKILNPDMKVKIIRPKRLPNNDKITKKSSRSKK